STHPRGRRHALHERTGEAEAASFPDDALPRRRTRRTTRNTSASALDSLSRFRRRTMFQARNVTKVFGLPAGRAREILDEAEDRSRAITAAGGVLAVDDVSFDVAQGELFVIMGLSGSGKSTLIRMVNRLVEPTTGQIYYDGTDIAAMGEAQLRELRNKRLSMVFQHFALFPHRTIRDNAAYGLKTRGVPRHERLERADQALHQVGLGQWGDAYPEELSGGMQQRVG